MKKIRSKDPGRLWASWGQESYLLGFESCKESYPSFFFQLNEPSEKQTQAEKNQNINLTSDANRVKQSCRMRLRPLAQAHFFSSLFYLATLHNMWGLRSPPGIEPVSRGMEVWVLTPGLPENSQMGFLIPPSWPRVSSTGLTYGRTVIQYPKGSILVDDGLHRDSNWISQPCPGPGGGPGIWDSCYFTKHISSSFSHLGDCVWEGCGVKTSSVGTQAEEYWSL